jgi:hypothetical protein
LSVASASSIALFNIRRIVDFVVYTDRLKHASYRPKANDEAVYITYTEDECQEHHQWNDIKESMYGSNSLKSYSDAVFAVLEDYIVFFED